MRRLRRHLLLITSFALLLSGLSATTARSAVFARATSASARAFALAPRGVQLLAIDGASMHDFREHGGTLTLPLPEGGELALELEPFDLLGPSPQLQVTADDGVHPIAVDLTLFKGRVAGDPDSWALISMSPRGVLGTVQTAATRWEIAPTETPRAGALSLHAVRDAAFAPLGAHSFTCDAEDEAKWAPHGLRLLTPEAPGRRPGRESAQVTPTRLVFDVAIDCDNELLNGKFAGDVTNATNYVLTMLGTASLIYERDINCTLRIPFLNLWSATDPYGTTTTQTALPEFRDWWNANRTGVTRSLAHLVSGRSLGGGIAYIDVLCDASFAYGVSGIDAIYSYPTNTSTWDVNVVAHEMGHNFISPHTHSCYWQAAGFTPPATLLDSCFTAEGSCYSGPSNRLPPDKGTVMSYCHLLGSFANTIRLEFHTACKTLMRAAAENAPCVDIPVVAPPRSLTVTPVSDGGNLAWLASPTAGLIRYDVYRSGIQLDLHPPLLGSTTGLSFHDASLGTWYYKVKAARSADSSGFSNEAKALLCPFNPAVNFAAGALPIAMATGDFDADGIADLAIASFTGDNLNILRGLGAGGVGNGSFAAPASFALNPGSNPSCLAVADFDEDGILDVAVGNNTSQTVAIMKGGGAAGVGNGTFTLLGEQSGGGEPWAITSADFNDDGITDLAVAGGGSNVTVLLGNGSHGVGNGTFAGGVGYFAGSSPTAVTVGDFNEDGIWDLAVAGSNGARVLLGNGIGAKGDGTFLSAGPNLPCGSSPFSILAGDFNEDGIPDLAVGNSATNGSISILAGLGTAGVGNGTFAPKVDYAAGASPYSVVMADWSEDGIADLAVANSSTAKVATVIVGRGAAGVGNGTFDGANGFGVGTSPRVALALDFDEDGSVDLAVANSTSNNVSILRAGCVNSLDRAVTLTAPNGSEQWVSESEHAITWTRGPGVIAVDLQVSRDGGTHWETIAAAQTGTQFNWTVTEPASVACRVRAIDPTAPNRNDASDANFTIIPFSAVDAPTSIAAFGLTKIEPNPARHQLTVSFSLPDRGPATLELIDLAGRRIASQNVGTLGAGQHRIPLLDRATLDPGLYFVRLTRGAQTRSMKVAIIQ